MNRHIYKFTKRRLQYEDCIELNMQMVLATKELCPCIEGLYLINDAWVEKMKQISANSISNTTPYTADNYYAHLNHEQFDIWKEKMKTFDYLIDITNEEKLPTFDELYLLIDRGKYKNLNEMISQS